jgi:hypothetical protein
MSKVRLNEVTGNLLKVTEFEHRLSQEQEAYEHRHTWKLPYMPYVMVNLDCQLDWTERCIGD